MRSESRSGEPSASNDTFVMLNVMYFVVRCVSFVHEMFTRRIGTMGLEYPGFLIAVGGAVFVPLAAITVAPPEYGSQFLRPYIWLVITLAVLHTFAKQAQTRHIHRHYIGDPWWTSLGGRRGEWLLGGAFAALGFVLCNTIGVLHIVSLICSSFCQAMIEEREKRTVHRMRDAAIEAEDYATRMANR